MSLTEVEADLFDYAKPGHVLCHGVNLHGLMGAGIAKQFAARYPGMVSGYQHWCATARLGDVQFALVRPAPRPVVVANMATQRKPGRNANRLAVVASVARVVRWTQGLWAITHGMSTVVMPRVGCGIGGLDWTADVRPILHEFSRDVDIIICTPRS